MLKLNDRFRKIRNKLKEDKIVTDYSTEELDYLRKPVGKAMYKVEQEEKVVKPLRKGSKKEEEVIPRWKERLICDICGGEYTRSAVSRHRNTKKHKIYAQVNKKLVGILTGKI